MKGDPLNKIRVDRHWKGNQKGNQREDALRGTEVDDELKGLVSSLDSRSKGWGCRRRHLRAETNRGGEDIETEQER